MSIVHSPEQREILADIQAFMSLVEGYSNLVMDMVGEETLDSYKEMSTAFKHRRDTKSGAERFIERMLGFDLKLQQYQSRMSDRLRPTAPTTVCILRTRQILEARHNRIFDLLICRGSNWSRD